MYSGDEIEMSERMEREDSKKLIRVALIFTGGVFITLSLLADTRNFGESERVGIGQILLLLFGFLIMLSGFLGKSFLNFYRGMAIILLNTILFLGILELSAIAVARLNIIPTYSDIALSKYLELPYYRDRDWSEAYWLEARQVENYQYQPFVLWRHRPFEGTHVNVNQDGIRVTPGAECIPGAFTVYVFGGSSMWGWGSPDWGTIPAYLQAGLEEIIKRPVCVVNMGEVAYVSTQSLLSLILQLQKGNIPDVVLFLGGFNDVHVAFESGEPDTHHMLFDIPIAFEEPENHLLYWLRATKSFWLAKALTQSAGVYDVLLKQYQDSFAIHHQDTDELAYAVLDNFLDNYNIIQRLADEFGFQSFFFWEPHLAVDQKELTSHELDIRSEFDAPLAYLVGQAYGYLTEMTLEYENLFYIADVYYDRDDQIWIDSSGHVTPEGNKLIAEEILNIVRDLIVIEKE
jgi:lysophospholipase L1-like esterase